MIAPWKKVSGKVGTDQLPNFFAESQDARRLSETERE